MKHTGGMGTATEMSMPAKVMAVTSSKRMNQNWKKRAADCVAVPDMVQAMAQKSSVATAR